MKGIFKNTLILCLLLMALEARAQNPSRYNQYLFNQSFVNPAYAGYRQGIGGDAYFRRQWMGLDGSPTTMGLAVDGAIPAASLGIGFQGFSDKIGVQSTTGAQLNLSYQLRLGDYRFLSFGVGGGFLQNTFDVGELDPGNVEDPILGVGLDNSIQPDINVGMFYFSQYNYLGLSVSHALATVLKPDESSFAQDLTPQMNLTGGILLDVGETLSFVPSFFYRDDFENFASVDVNGIFAYMDVFWLGAGYRTSLKLPWNNDQQVQQDFSSLIGQIKFYFLDQIRVGYVFDYGLKGSNQRNFSSHEVSVGFILPNRSIRDDMLRLF
ncbi:type IX secretion system membrane protein PorP/SprF [Algoriphagus sp. AGSA1]|uniref:PorP/SprF family type IX secretion system membrane protein n=1 Tax=Algoriphagus sp. AGSA1 TaxID=2907213 RepID=UPI001F468F1C|nr:type IX secretion system membrane protein PorP/SprF [Algoriphagus sp. AGSA1]MCE7053619.1 type IX secretion system membrane protein PorP/SprF [Algoriphagus sp. AGSA1]